MFNVLDFINNLVSILIGLAVFFGGFRRWFRKRVTEPIEAMESNVADLSDKFSNLAVTATMLNDQLSDVTSQLDTVKRDVTSQLETVKRIAERAHQRLDEHVNAHVRAGMTTTSGDSHG